MDNMTTEPLFSLEIVNSLHVAIALYQNLHRRVAEGLLGLQVDGPWQQPLEKELQNGRKGEDHTQTEELKQESRSSHLEEALHRTNHESMICNF